MAVEQQPAHIVFSSIPAWGHARPFCILAARLVKEYKNVIVTIILTPNLLSKAQAEASSELRGTDDESVLRRIRILSSFSTETPNPFEMMVPLGETYPKAYETLLKGEPITCAAKNITFDAVPPPSLVILDFFSFPQMAATRAITGNKIPVLAWATGFAFSFIRSLGPESMGGLGNMGKKIDAEAARLGVSPEEIGDKMFGQVNGSVIKMPGVPEMYDYEYYPQKLAFHVPIAMVLRGAYSLLEQSDGIIHSTPYELEKEPIEGLKQWFSNWGNKDVHVIGPLLPDTFGKAEQSHQGADAIKEFLNNMLQKEGAQSVIYISFGTVFWPAETKYIEELLKILIEKRVPFIMSHASPFAKIPEGLAEEVKASGIGLLSSWSPQQYILSHPATGWFLTHCGHNGVLEALGNGVPLIAWPFEADQPPAALYLSQVLNVAIELIEVRTGENGLKPLKRSGKAPKGTVEAVSAEIREVVDVCRGPKGRVLRENAQALKKKFANAWEKDGESRKDLADVLKKYVPQVLG
ncbi:UDP-Glycosyltransferase/glycogen phosphorylase [Agrocybe pediades]|nr:UDP-Glycosyltransferase/glycogen phosphorylase [Agrocybe pediades]